MSRLRVPAAGTFAGRSSCTLKATTELANEHNFVFSSVNICSSINRPLTQSALNGLEDTASVGCVMSNFICVFRARFALRIALTGAAAGLLAGCSNSERLSDPWSNPFQSSANTGGQALAAVAAAPVSPVQSRPLAAPAASSPPQASSRVSAASPPQAGQVVAGWSAQGGSPIVVAQGETVAILSNRYGVPQDALIRTNGFSSASQIQPGTRLVIPVYNAALAASSGAKVAANQANSKAAAPGKVLGTPPRTLASQAASLKSGNGTAAATKAAANKSSLSPAQKTAQKPEAKGQTQKVAALKGAPASAVPNAKEETVRTAKAETAGVAKGAGHDPSQATASADQAKASGAPSTAKPEFRWPARGRIIEAFKPGGNDGINIALPEGTSVKAAESGVVAYAGNELKGYGNLILIRHPNGFVSAYANTGEIDVKRGETVKRGQTIAKSGQSGNVSTPQLHFELRKGTTPVDPTQYLAGV
jgi:murein DD-endopeptidase MepM/ murein hydrolase activator NlpD